MADMTDLDHAHNWVMTKRRVAEDGHIAAELFECLICPARKWSADTEIYDEWVAELPRSGPIPVEGAAEQPEDYPTREGDRG